METMNNKEQAQTAQQHAAQPSEPMKVKVLRITAIKGHLNKTVDLPVDEDGIKWLRRIFAMDKSTINVEGNGKNTLRVRFSLLQGDKIF